MDILSHGLWSAAVYKSLKNKTLRVKQAIFWGVFPDLFAFTIPFLRLLLRLVEGDFELKVIAELPAAEPPFQSFWEMKLAINLYNFSHSLIIFAAIFMAIWLLRKRPRWELLAWALHIVIDIPTHSYEFYPTPFLWPISAWKFDGVSWAEPWFLILNYAALLAVFLVIRSAKPQSDS